jgi:hypothetical protein
LNYQDLSDRFSSIPVQLSVVHSLQNCIISINHVEKLIKFKLDERFLIGKFDGYFKTPSISDSRTHLFSEEKSITPETPDTFRQLIQNFLAETNTLL